MDQYEEEDSEWMKGLELINSNEENDLNNEKSVGDVNIPEKVLDDIIQSNSFDQYYCSPAPPSQSNPMYPVQYYENQNYSLTERNSFITESYVPTSHGLLKITYPVSLVPPSGPNLSGSEQTSHYHQQQQIPAHKEIVDLVQRHFTHKQQQQSSLQTSSSCSSSSSSSYWPQPTDYHLLHSSSSSHYSSATNNNNNQIHQCNPTLSMNPLRSSSSSSLTFQSTTSQPSSPFHDIFQVTSQLDFVTFLSMDSSEDDDSDDNDEEVDQEETENLLKLFEDFPSSSSSPAEDNNQAKIDHSEEQSKKGRDRKKKSELSQDSSSSSCSMSRKRRKIHHNNGDEDEDEYLPTDNDEEEFEEEIADDQSNFSSQEPKPPPHSVKRKKSAMAMTVGSPKARKKASQFARDILMDWLVKHEGEH
jgi:hypothetical protein